jgi:hypothetical protein
MKALALSMCLGIVTTAAAQTGHDQSIHYGAGVKTCAGFAQLYREHPDWTESLFFAWAQGFLSGRNDLLVEALGEYQDVGSVSNEKQRSLLRWYCDQHPLISFQDAVYYLSSQLKTRRVPK